jgi:WD40 repeat protein
LHEVWTLAFSPDGKTLVSGSKNGTLYGWNAQPKPKNSGLFQLPKCSRAVFSPVTNLVAGVATDRTIFLWNPAAAESRITLAELGTNNYGLVFLPNGDLVVGEHGGSLKVWTAATRQVEVKGRLHSSRAEPLAVLSQSNALLADHGTNGLCLWDLAAWKIKATWTNTARSVSHVVSPNEKMFVTGYQSGAVDALNLHTRRIETSWRAHRRHVAGLAFSPGSDLLATASEEGTTKLWDFHTGKEVALLQGTFGAVSGVAFSPDGQRLATSGDRREMIRLWDMRTHQEVGGLEGQGSYFRGLSFSRDGNRFMAVNDEGLLHVWQSPSWQEIQAAERADSATEGRGMERTSERLKR